MRSGIVAPSDATIAEPAASPPYAKARSFAVRGLLDAFSSLGFHPHGVLDDLSLPEARLMDPTAHMSWDDYLLLLERLKGIAGGEAAMEECAFRLILQNSLVRGLAHAFSGPRPTLLEVPAFMGSSLYTHISSFVHPIGEDQLLFHHTVPATSRISPLFIRMSRGLLRAYPRLFGQPEAHVQMSADLHRMVFRITLPEPRRTCPKTQDSSMPYDRHRLYALMGENPGDRYLEFFMDPGGNLARIRYLTERLSDHGDLSGFVQDLMALLKEVFGCTYARLSFRDAARDTMTPLASLGTCRDGSAKAHDLSLRGRLLGQLEVDRTTAAMPIFRQVVGTLIPFLSLALARYTGPASALDEALPCIAPRERALQTYASLHAFTKREEEILRQLGRGLTNKEIAQETGTSPKTIENQVAAMLRKAQATSRLELLARALG